MMTTIMQTIITMLVLMLVAKTIMFWGSWLLYNTITELLGKIANKIENEI